uniref:Uncharacterized protein n=1 Tax=Anguilla anguilla TaxID=7936 RepID=A0A0E9QWE9_ANGAN
MKTSSNMMVMTQLQFSKKCNLQSDSFITQKKKLSLPKNKNKGVLSGVGIMGLWQ